VGYENWMITRRLLIEYSLLVGVPFILLLGVLHRGQALKAPADIQGNWQLAVNGSSAAGSSCETILRSLDGSPMTITQAGSYLTAGIVNHEHAILQGRSEGRSLWLESVPSKDSVLNGDMLRLTGTVVDEQGDRVIRGMLLMPRMVDCPPQAFEATSPSGDRGRGKLAER
jgi:hypothetical protein